MKKMEVCMLILFVFVLSLFNLAVAKGENVSVAILTNQRTDVLEARVEIPYDTDSPWSVGLSGIYFKDAEHPSGDFGLGLFAKVAVDPNTTVPVSEWLPVIGDWFDLPESVSIENYFIFKGDMYPVGDNDFDLSMSIGAGGESGPLIIEYTYNIIEGGDSGNPIMFSGSVLYLGLKPIRF